MLLTVNNLRVRYGAIEAVREISLAAGDGLVVVLGANGAGKSSVLNAIAGRVRVSGGSVQWAGRDVTRLPAYRIAREGIALVPEGRKVFAPLSVHDNLLVGAHTARSRRRRDDLLVQVHALFPVLAERAGQPAGLLSGGEQQMLALGRAMMSDPQLILMDEPSTGLSPVMVDVVMRAVSRIARSGVGVLMAEQNARAALEIADSALVLQRGRVMLRGPAGDVKTHDGVVRAFLGDAAVRAADGSIAAGDRGPSDVESER
jgi:branched-chain amino acid transport system ATP-binding protein